MAIGKDSVYDYNRFQFALSVVLDHEGGYTDDNNDPGGATKYGISQRFITENKIPITDIKSLEIDEASSIYKKYFWDKYNISKIENLIIATKVFDTAVNIGPIPAGKILQRAANDVSKKNIQVDGIIGNQTIQLVNDINPLALHNLMRDYQAAYYRDIVEKNPKLLPDLTGLLKRAKW